MNEGSPICKKHPQDGKFPKGTHVIRKGKDPRPEAGKKYFPEPKLRAGGVLKQALGV
jgi:hypothetical protein